HGDRQLTGPRPEHLTGHADEVAGIELDEPRVLVAETVGARVELDAPGLVHQVREAGLAVVADRHDAGGEAHRPGPFHALVVRVAEPLAQAARPLRHRISAAEGIDPAATQRIELLAAQPDQLVVVRVRHGFASPAARPIVTHASRPLAQSRYALMKASRSPSM